MSVPIDQKAYRKAGRICYVFEKNKQICLLWVQLIVWLMLNFAGCVIYCVAACSLWSSSVYAGTVTVRPEAQCLGGLLLPGAALVLTLGCEHGLHGNTVCSVDHMLEAPTWQLGSFVFSSRLLKAISGHRGCGKLATDEIHKLSPAMERFVLRINAVRFVIHSTLQIVCRRLGLPRPRRVATGVLIWCRFASGA